MLTVLSIFDERSRPKGSRDPLGLEATWTWLGRKVVGNLTTVTGNLDNFIVALLCCHHAHSGERELGVIQERFLRAEQLFAYVRVRMQHSASVLGVTRAQTKLDNADAGGPIPIGSGPEAQLLANQLGYGLWGLYSTALQVAGLVERDGERRPTPSARELIERFLNALGTEWWSEFQKNAGREAVSLSDIDGLAKPFLDVTVRQDVRRAVVDALLCWERQSLIQRELFSITSQRLSTQRDVAGPADARTFCEWVLAQPDLSNDLRTGMKNIASAEPVLVFASVVMNWLLGSKGASRVELASRLAPALANLQFSRDWQEQGGLPHRRFLADICAAGEAGDAGGVIDVILSQNREVMASRGGAPWLEWEGDKLKVRMPNDRAMLPQRLADGCREWWNSYFLGSFLNIMREGY